MVTFYQFRNQIIADATKALKADKANEESVTLKGRKVFDLIDMRYHCAISVVRKTGKNPILNEGDVEDFLEAVYNRLSKEGKM